MDASLVDMEKFEKSEDEESDIDIGGGDNEKDVRNGESSDPEDEVQLVAYQQTWQPATRVPQVNDFVQPVCANHTLPNAAKAS